MCSVVSTAGCRVSQCSVGGRLTHVHCVCLCVQCRQHGWLPCQSVLSGWSSHPRSLCVFLCVQCRQHGWLPWQSMNPSCTVCGRPSLTFNATQFSAVVLTCEMECVVYVQNLSSCCVLFIDVVIRYSSSFLCFDINCLTDRNGFQSVKYTPTIPQRLFWCPTQTYCVSRKKHS